MPRLSEYVTVTVPGSSDFLFLHNSGVNDSRLSVSGFLGNLNFSLRPTTSNIYNFGLSTSRWLSGYINYLDVVNINVAGATTGIFPNTSGQSGKALTNNGSGVFSWVTSGGGGSTSPGGLNTYIQYNNSGAFSGVPNFTLSGTIVTVSGSQNIYSNRNDFASFVVTSSGQQEYAVNFRHPSGTTHQFTRSGNIFLNNHLEVIGNSPNAKIYTYGMSGLINTGGGIEVGYSTQRGQLVFAPQFGVMEFAPNAVDYPGQGFKLGVGASDLDFQCIPANGYYVNYQSYGGNGIKIMTNSFLSATNGEIIFAPQIVEKARFDYRGFLGIGTASPTGTLHVVTQYDNAYGIVLAPSGAGQAVNLFECRSSSGTKNIFIDTAVRLNADTIIVNSGLSGAAYIWPMAYGWSFPSGSLSGTGINVSYEIPILLPCKANYAQARSKVAGSGNVSGLVFDIKVTGSSIWNLTPANRLTIPNNSKTGVQSSFDSQIISQGSYLSLDFVTLPSGIYPQDLVVELLTLAQR